MKVISWNVNKRKNAWTYENRNFDADVALLQEAPAKPPEMKPSSVYEVVVDSKNNNSILMSSNKGSDIKLYKFFNPELNCVVFQDERIGNVFLLSVYGDLSVRSIRNGKNASMLKDRLIGKICMCVEWLKNEHNAEHIIMAGDFNMDRRMDDNLTSSRFARKGERVTNLFFDTILTAGFEDCVNKFYPNYVQTFWHSKSSFPWQLDHMFATPELFRRCQILTVDNDTQTLEQSDHAPLVAIFV